MFNYIDKNGDGQLSRGELHDAFSDHSMTVQASELDGLMEVIDLNGEDQLTLSEWVAATAPQDVVLGTDMLQQVFKYFDRHERGIIRAEDLQEQVGKAATLKDRSEADLQLFEDIIMEATAACNADGSELDFRVFCLMMQKMRVGGGNSRTLVLGDAGNLVEADGR